MKKTSLQREISISKITITEEQEKFQSKHCVVYGLYDDLGIESFKISNDWNTIDGISNLNDKLKSLKIRARYNTHRNATVFLCWIKNESIKDIEKFISLEQYIKAKKILLDKSIPV